MREQEHNLQVNVARYLEWKNIPFFAIPNGGQRHITVAAKLKAEGVKSGVADIFIMIGNSKFNGLFIELKIKGNCQSPKQKDFEALAKKQNYCYKLAYSLDEVMEIVETYLKIV